MFLFIHLSTNPRSEITRSPRIDPSGLQRAIKKAKKIGKDKQNGQSAYLSPLLCYPFTWAGYDIRAVQELLGYKDVKTNMVNANVLNREPKAVRRLLDD